VAVALKQVAEVPKLVAVSVKAVSVPPREKV